MPGVRRFVRGHQLKARAMSPVVVAIVLISLVAVALLFARRPPGRHDIPPEDLDARRFAKLLVAEIKLYNQAQVAEGRKSKDLYRRLRKDVDRASRMYHERVNKGSAGRADYFHDELVRELAGGDASALGEDYRRS